MLTKLVLDLHVNWRFLYSLFPIFFLGFWLGDLLASGIGSGTWIIQLGVLSLAEQSHIQIF